MDSLLLIREFLCDRLGVAAEKIVPETMLDAVGVDSLLILELMFDFEERFGIVLSKGLPPPRTVGEMAKLMDGLRNAQSN
ncbi:MAG TPA: acyl carrier protein [Accumulibacter sp.]|nr:acyl carrier protein [Accumulibacter sp.]